MRTFAKFAIVAGGYVTAGLIATLVVAAHDAEAAADSVGADGMYAFGDLLLFIAVFGFVALFPTCAAIYFLWTRKSMRSAQAARA
jgi:hypothetical protein